MSKKPLSRAKKRANRPTVLTNMVSYGSLGRCDETVTLDTPAAGGEPPQRRPTDAEWRGLVERLLQLSEEDLAATALALRLRGRRL